MSFTRYDQAAQQERRAAERAANLSALCLPSRALHQGTYNGNTGVAVPKGPRTGGPHDLIGPAR